MTETITAVDVEKAREFQGMVMRLVSAHLLIHGPENVSPHDILNALANAMCKMLRGLPDERRAAATAQVTRLLLDDAGCLSSDVLDEVERIRPLCRFVEGQVAGNA